MVKKSNSKNKPSKKSTTNKQKKVSKPKKTTKVENKKKPSKVVKHKEISKKEDTHDKSKLIIGIFIAIIILFVGAVLFTSQKVVPKDAHPMYTEPEIIEEPKEEVVEEPVVEKVEVKDAKPKLSADQKEYLDENLEPGMTTALSESDIKLNYNDKTTIGFALKNQAGLEYFDVNYNFVSAKIDDVGTRRPDIDAYDWMSPKYDAFQMQEDEIIQLPIEVTVPKEMEPGTYTFSISACYADETMQIGESGCGDTYNKRMGKTQKFNVVIE
ncbi:hypothetical protein HOD20_00140 [archaeon]|jgi:hypothetical protein|nr:hypothetical protein [archaeon]MBT4646957.1 hypothetical protein [archaeon]MBT6821677.1 hypothetical protein [archaeon]MBT7392208.1 hypothetical protein [archaeon]